MLLLFCLCSGVVYCEDRIATVVVTPEQTTIKSGQKYRFVARGYSEDGEEIPFSPEWIATGGSISQNGWFTAGAKAGVYSVTAIAKKTGARGTASIWVESGADIVLATKDTVVKMELLPQKVELNPGDKVNFQVVLYNQRGERVLPSKNLIWHVTGGAITSEGLYQAGGAPGNYSVQVKEPNGVGASAQVTIKGLISKIVRVKITPTNVNLKPQGKQRFFATGYNSAGNVVRFTPRWKATGGWIDKNGVYYAGERDGKYFVKAIAPGGASSTASIIVDKVKIDRVEIFPEGAILAPGQIEKFTLKAYDYKGNTVDAFPLWSASGGIIQADGTYQAGSIPGKYKLKVTVENVSITAEILIKEGGKPVQLRVNPPSAILKSGESVQFKITAYDGQGNRVPSSMEFLSSGGEITKTGKFTAGKIPGNYILKVTTPEGLTTQAAIKVIPVTSDPTSIQSLTVRPSTIKVMPGTKTQFTAFAYDKAGLEVPCDIQWHSTGGGNISHGVFEAGAQEGTFYIIASTTNNIKAVATVVVDKTATTEEKKPNFYFKVSPQQVNLKPGQRSIVNVELLNAQGQSVKHGPLKWKATGGTISQEGLYTAGDTPGTYYLIIEEETHKVFQKIPVTIFQTTASKTETTQISRVQKQEIIEMLAWKIGREINGFRKIKIKATVKAKDGELIKFIRYRQDDSPQVLYQKNTSTGERILIEGNVYLPNSKKIAFLLYDSQRRVIYKKEESLD